jgi:hypothetical protein
MTTSTDTREYTSQSEAATPGLVTSGSRTGKARVRTLPGMLKLVRRTLESSHYDTSFERPDLIEDDYFRFRNQPRD